MDTGHREDTGWGGPQRPGGWRDAVIVICVCLAYGAVTRAAMSSTFLGGLWTVVSVSFLFFTPFAFGALSTWLGHRLQRLTTTWAVVLPCLVVVCGLASAVIFELEALICVIMAAPILFPFAILGSFAMRWFLKRGEQDGESYLGLGTVLALPFLAGLLETWVPLDTELRTIEDEVRIAAPAERVWAHIASVEAIDPSELPPSWVYALDFPRPIAAELSRPGVGGVRIATFERGVSFFEEVTEWEPRSRLSFSIHADPEFIPASAFDRHIVIGGRFFDVLDGSYEIEDLGQEGVLLRLTSHHRLSTPFNRYASWWSSAIMHEIQGTILGVIRERCEGPTPL